MTATETKKFQTEYSMEHEGVPTSAATVDIRPGWDVIFEYYKPFDGEAAAPKIRFGGYIVWREKSKMGDIRIAIDGNRYTASLPEEDAKYFAEHEGGLASLNEDLQYLMDEYVGILTIKDQAL